MIRSVDLKREYREIGDELNRAVQRVMESGCFIQGPEKKAFEKEFTHWIGGRYAVGLNSGSDALFLALKALGVGDGDEVITVSHTFVSTVDAIVRCGARPVFVDIDPETYCMEVSSLKESLTKKTRAIIPVHLYGHPAEMDTVTDLACDHGLSVVEDACQAHGARYKGQMVGTIGDIGCFSFYPSKNLGCFGDGGMIVTDNEMLARKVHMLGNYGQEEKYHFCCIGINSRLDEIQAAVLSVKLRHLERWNEQRREIAQFYKSHLNSGELTLPIERPGISHVYHQFVVRHRARDQLQAEIRHIVETAVHYPVPVHLQPAYSGYRPQIYLPVTEKICKEIVSLPVHPWLSGEELQQIVDEVNRAIG
jgi:dTDP-4-amino-4,6-dideoxygalactose transaminase